MDDYPRTVQMTIGTRYCVEAIMNVPTGWYYCINPRNTAMLDDLWYGVYPTETAAQARAQRELDEIAAAIHQQQHAVENAVMRQEWGVWPRKPLPPLSDIPVRLGLFNE